MELLESVLDSAFRRMTHIAIMQFGFVPDRDTMDAILILCQLQKKLVAVYKPLHLEFVDLEKAFHSVPKKGVIMGSLETWWG